MEKFYRFTVDCYHGLRFTLKDMVIFPGTNLSLVRRLCLLTFGVDVVCEIFGIIHFTSWQGALLAYGVLSLLNFLSSESTTVKEAPVDDSLTVISLNNKPQAGMKTSSAPPIERGFSLYEEPLEYKNMDGVEMEEE